MLPKLACEYAKTCLQPGAAARPRRILVGRPPKKTRPRPTEALPAGPSGRRGGPSIWRGVL